MGTAAVKLVTFAISHYCEKARWALDWHGIDYREISWPPGVHVMLARRAGAKQAALPILLAGDDIIEGSDAIIDWAETHSDGASDSLMPPGQSEIARQVEARLDKIVGVNTRRLLCAHALPDQTRFVKPMLFANTSPLPRFAANLMWPVSKKLMARMYRTSGDAAAESRAILEREFAWLEKLLTSGNTYLTGKKFSRADLTAASLVALFAQPEEMPTYRDAQFPDELADTIEQWSSRPLFSWVKEIYREHRGCR